ncbi:MAG: hypothetical protein ACPG6R_10940 [Aequoribacter sp.]|uniref:hypothetical protein n=1 Tax=Aequoribacter sp. TaxID=2847771 RepID=UPI003C3C280C
MADGIKVTMKPVRSVSVLDHGKLADFFVSRFVSAVVRRTRAGLDTKGRRFKPYSKAYLKELAARGEELGVDLWRTGGMLGSVNERFRQWKDQGQDNLLVGIGPSSAVSNSGQHNRPANNVLGFYHQKGRGHNEKRKWLGLTRRERKEIAREMAKMSGAITEVRGTSSARAPGKK